MNIKRNIIFALEARKKNGVAITENVPIRMRVNYSGQRIEFTMPYRIDAAKWDATKQRVKNGCTNKLKVSFLFPLIIIDNSSGLLPSLPALEALQMKLTIIVFSAFKLLNINYLHQQNSVANLKNCQSQILTPKT